MKKAINKTEREHILLSLVIDACVATGKKIVNELKASRTQLGHNLRDHWQKSMPNVSREDQLALLRDHCANALSFQPAVFKADLKGKAVVESDFGKVYWRNDGLTEVGKARRARLATLLMRALPGASGVINDDVRASYHSTLSMSASYPDIIRGFQPPNLYRAGVAPDTQDPLYADKLLSIHDASVKQLSLLRDLLFSAEAMYEDLAAAIAPLKTGQALAEAMPEAVKHFPESLTYVKPTKEIADPAAINEIRAKLKKGLPI